MRILLVTDYATPTAGAEVLMIGLRDGLRARGHDAHLLASRAELLAGKFAADDACFGTTSRFQPLIEAFNPSATLAVRRAVRDFRPDVVHVGMFLWQMSPAILPFLDSVPSLYYAMTYKLICPLGTKLLPDGSACREPPGRACLRGGCLSLASWGPRMVQRTLLARWTERLDRIVAVSQDLRERIEKEGVPVTDVIHPGVPIRPRRGPLSGTPTIVFAGRIVPEKGLLVLVDALALVRREVPDARTVIAGDGPQRGELVRRIAEMDMADCVTLTGQISRSEMESLFDAAWVQVVPSVWAEPFGLVAIEAMMRGTAVVASRTGGLSESVRDGRTGILVPPGDAGALARALTRVLTRRETAESMGRAGRHLAMAGFQETRMVERFETLYRTMTAARSPAASLS